MKRIIGRKIARNQTEDYGDFKTPVLNLKLIDPKAQLFRIRWASDLIDILRLEGSMTYNFLDIGTNNGNLAAIVAQKHMNPDDKDSPTIHVDAIELHKTSYLSAEELAKQAREQGLTMNVYNTSFEEYETDKLYDVITAFEVLEHMPCPLFSIEKIYDMLEIGGHVLITVPEEHGKYGLVDKNRFHYWSSTIQSVIGVLFHDERRWHIKQCTEVDNLIHMFVQKRTCQE